MTTISYSHARQNFKSILDKVVDDSEPIVIERRNGENVVLVSELDYRSMDETAYLAASPANKKHLDEAISRLESGEGVELDINDL